MELRKRSFTSIIQPIFKSLQVHSEDYYEAKLPQNDLMPLFEVVEAIHHSFYFKKPLIIHFEQYNQEDQLVNFTLQGFAMSNIQDSGSFAFKDQSGLSYLLNLDQIVSAINL